MRISIPAIGRHIWCSWRISTPFLLFHNLRHLGRWYFSTVFLEIDHQEENPFLVYGKFLSLDADLFWFLSPPQMNFYRVSKYAAVFMNNWVVRWFATDPVSGFVPAPRWTTTTQLSVNTRIASGEIPASPHVKPFNP